ncbi:hypothetical protein ACFL4Q_03435 [candidate division KSB1 bacterium]
MPSGTVGGDDPPEEQPAFTDIMQHTGFRIDRSVVRVSTELVIVSDAQVKFPCGVLFKSLERGGSVCGAVRAAARANMKSITQDAPAILLHMLPMKHPR